MIVQNNYDLVMTLFTGVNSLKENRSDGYACESYNLYVPSGCAACGGPYPYCTTSCPMFDD